VARHPATRLRGPASRPGSRGRRPARCRMPSHTPRRQGLRRDSVDRRSTVRDHAPTPQRVRRAARLR
jgi:hypothetical protein